MSFTEWKSVKGSPTETQLLSYTHAGPERRAGEGVEEDKVNSNRKTKVEGAARLTALVVGPHHPPVVATTGAAAQIQLLVRAQPINQQERKLVMRQCGGNA